jgi:hypothetical protein
MHQSNKERHTMATLHEAELFGMSAAMSSKAERKVPAEYDTDRLRDACLGAYDRMQQSLRGCVPAPPGPPAASKITEADSPARKCKVKQEAEAEPEPPPQPSKRSMLAILEGSLA